jgi:hypothetical protein
MLRNMDQARAESNMPNEGISDYRGLSAWSLRFSSLRRSIQRPVAGGAVDDFDEINLKHDAFFRRLGNSANQRPIFSFDGPSFAHDDLIPAIPDRAALRFVGHQVGSDMSTRSLSLGIEPVLSIEGDDGGTVDLDNEDSQVETLGCQSSFEALSSSIGIEPSRFCWGRSSGLTAREPQV